jgi:hypothetical protein
VQIHQGLLYGLHRRFVAPQVAIDVPPYFSTICGETAEANLYVDVQLR